MVRTAKLACAALLVPLGCSAGAFACADDAQCGDAGHCEPEGWCSFPDESCPGGRRFGAHSGDGLGGACVPGRDEASTGSGMPESSTGLGTTVGVTVESSSAEETTVSIDDGSTTTTAVETSMSGPGSSSTGEPADPSLLLWLDFDDEAAPWADSSLDAHAVTCEGAACPVLDAGVAGNAARFDGIDDDLWVDDVLAMPGEFTLALWITVDVLPTEIYQDVLTRAYGPTYANSWGFGFPPSLSVIRFVVHDDAAQLTVGQIAWPAEGGWHHVAGTFDGASARFYFDGSFVSAIDVAAIAYDDHPVTIGADVQMQALVNYFGGAVDDVRIYARALPDDEVAGLAAN
jgi:hypothetical protein